MKKRTAIRILSVEYGYDFFLLLSCYTPLATGQNRVYRNFRKKFSLAIAH